MPELIEVEYYRRLADRVVAKPVASVEAPDAWFLKKGLTSAVIESVFDGATITSTGRTGKLLRLVLDGDRPDVGLRFGMTGRLALDGDGPIQKLEYASGRDDPAWNRFGLRFVDGTHLRLSDPRRLGGVELDPDPGALGPDAWTITPGQLRRALADSAAPLKARLLDQAKIAGLGNLLVDETLWRAGLDPARAAGELGDGELRRLQRRIRATVSLLFDRGGSHTGDLQAERHRGGHCPRDGAELLRRTVGGRTTYSCPAHQH